MTDILLPELGEGISDVEVRDVLIDGGETLKKDQVILILETDKASMEIPSEYNGNVSQVYVKAGDKISPGDKILTITNQTDDKIDAIDQNFESEASNALNQEIEKIEEEHRAPSPNTTSITQSNILATPSTRKLARELGCDISLVPGSGEKERVTKQDILSYVNRHISSNDSNINSEDLKNILKKEISTIKEDLINELSQNKENNIQEVDYNKWGVTETIPLNKIKQATGKNMSKAWSTIPQVTQFDNADITNLYKSYSRLKKQNTNSNIKISLIPFYIKILTRVIKDFPNFNSSLSFKKDSIIQKKYINIGIAVDTSRGLVVPVIKNCERKSLSQINRDLNELANKAHNNNLELEDIQGGTITISSLGGIGGANFTPIVNPPQVGILGFSKAEYKIVCKNNRFIKRLILPFTLTYDHRVIDGAEAVKFTTKLKQGLSSVKLIEKNK